MAGGFNLPGLGGQTAQSTGSAGTETGVTSDGKGGTTPSVSEQQADRAIQQNENAMKGTAASRLVNTPPPVITGASESLKATAPYEALGDDEKTPAMLVSEAMAIQSLADQGVVSAGEAVIYSSHPIANFQVGRFKFDKGILRLNGEDQQAFEELLKKIPAQEAARVQKVDVAAAEQIVKDRLDAQRTATKQFDSSTGERMSGIGKLGPTVGAQPLGFENRAQQDMNTPVIPTAPVDPAGETGLDYGAHTPPADALDNN